MHLVSSNPVRDPVSSSGTVALTDSDAIPLGSFDVATGDPLLDLMLQRDRRFITGLGGDSGLLFSYDDLGSANCGLHFRISDGGDLGGGGSNFRFSSGAAGDGGVGSVHFDSSRGVGRGNDGENGGSGNSRLSGGDGGSISDAPEEVMGHGEYVQHAGEHDHFLSMDAVLNGLQV